MSVIIEEGPSRYASIKDIYGQEENKKIVISVPFISR